MTQGKPDPPGLLGSSPSSVAASTSIPARKGEEGWGGETGQ